MKLICCLFAILVIERVSAQDSISVLFVGNSYVYVNDLPGTLNALTLSLGDEMTYDSKTNGGYTFQMHADDAQTYQRINSKPWDFVVLQGQSQEPSFPTSQVNSQTLPPAVQLADSVYGNRFCSHAMYFMTWGRENGDSQWDSINTFNKMNDRLRLAYLRITDSAQACVAPVGSAWRYVRDNSPTIQLYSADGSHPSIEGTYLTACTFYASLFRKSPVGATYLAGLDPLVAETLQEAAALTVLDSLEMFKLRSNDEVAIADFSFSQLNGLVTFENSSWRASNYHWDFGDGTQSFTESPQHTYASNGTYSVQLIASNECGEDTLMQAVQVTTAGLKEHSNIFINKNLGDGFYQIVTDQHEGVEAQLYAMDGVLVETIQSQGGSYFIDLRLEPAGIYLFKCGPLHIRLLK